MSFPGSSASFSPIFTTENSIFQEFFALLGKLTHSDLVRQIEYLKVENQILRGKIGKRVSTTEAEKRRLIKFGLPLGGKIKNIISIVAYSTFRKWVTADGSPRKLCAKGKNRKTNKDIIGLIVRLAKENPTWGYGRIMGELKKLEVISLSRNTIKAVLRSHGIDPSPKRGEDSWDSFIKRHFETLWACDFFTKTVWTVIGPKVFHVLFFINIRTRKVHVAGVSPNPTRRWVVDAAKSISFLFQNTENKLLVRDGDGKFSPAFDEFFRSSGTTVKKIPYRSPNLNPYAEGGDKLSNGEPIGKHLSLPYRP